MNEQILKLLIAAHGQLDKEYQANTRYSQAVRVANATGGESPGSLGALAEAAYMESRGNDTRAMLDRLYTAIRDFNIPTPAALSEGKKEAPVDEREAFGFSIEELHKLKFLAGLGTKGEWYYDAEHNEGSFGEGEDVYSGFKSYVMCNEKGETLFDSMNSNAARVEIEYGDEDTGGHSYDGVALGNFRFIEAFRPEVAIRLIDALMQARTDLSVAVPQSPSGWRPIESAESVARKIIDAIMHDLDGRRGVLDGIETDMRDEMAEELSDLIVPILQPPPPSAKGDSNG